MPPTLVKSVRLNKLDQAETFLFDDLGLTAGDQLHRDRDVALLGLAVDAFYLNSREAGGHRRELVRCQPGLFIFSIQVAYDGAAL